MKNFISEIITDLQSSETDFSKITFIFPNKRAGRFLLYELGKRLEKPIFSPFIYSIGEYTEEVSGLQALDKTQSIFRFYEAYCELVPEDKREDFEVVYGWAQTLLSDFNEIDQYLIDAPSLFGYLSNIQDLNHWSKGPEKTEMVENYLAFWRKLPQYHTAFVNKLLSENEGYPGLQYKMASEKIGDYLSNSERKFVFAGFNALNPAEQKIIQTGLESGKAKIYWDIDKVFLEDPYHEASSFIRDYKSSWGFYKSGENPFKWVGDNYGKPKNIEIIGVPKNIGQAKKVGAILSEISAEEQHHTAVILGDQSLAPVMLNSLPENVEKANLTMGLPLSQTTPASFFDLLFKINSSGTKLYHKDVLTLLSHPLMSFVPTNNFREIVRKIQQENLGFLQREKIIAMAPQGNPREVFELCFGDSKDNINVFLNKLCKLSLKLKQPGKALQNEYLFHFNVFFNKLLDLMKQSFVNNIRVLHQIYKNSIYSESIGFSSEPFEGLQLMGLLESRGMDFETVIITSVNEGVLPPGKSDNSFIPYDLKKQYGLPTYKEKDAMYTYYFYRLLQRAKKVFLLYDCVPGDLNTGEKSRFLSQLKIEHQPDHILTENILAAGIPSLKKQSKEIPKTAAVMEKIKQLAELGFSPSALSLYIKNPLAFYNRYVLGVKEAEEVEETVAANTLGTVIHDTLENLYRDKKDKTYFLSENKIGTMLKEYPSEVLLQFGKKFGEEALSSGKNLIIAEVAKRYIRNFLKMEKKSLAKNRIEILELEKEMMTKIDLPEKDFPIFLKGKADRIDNFNGIRRIIDYKTGNVETSGLSIAGWDELVEDEKRAKAFQVLCYAYLYNAENPVEECLAGVIPFKKLGEGFLKFNKKDSSNSRKKEESITAETMNEFEKQLKKIVMEITDPEIPFVEKLEQHD